MSQTNASVRTYSLYHSKRHGPTELFYGLPQRNVDTSQGSLHATDLNVTATPENPSSPMLTEQRNVMTNSQTSQPWQPSGMTVLTYPSKSDAPTITNWKNHDIDAFERYCTESRLLSPIS